MLTAGGPIVRAYSKRQSPRKLRIRHPQAQNAVIVKPSTLLRLYEVLVKAKYRLLFSSRRKRKPGPKGPSEEIIRAIVETKRRNPRYGCPRIALLICRVFGVAIDKDRVRRVLTKPYHPSSTDGGPSWLTFIYIIGNTRDSLWSVDLFRCESIRLKSHWSWWSKKQDSRAGG